MLVLKIAFVPALAVACWPFYFAAYLFAAFFYTLALSVRRAGLWLRAGTVVDVCNVLLFGRTNACAPAAPKIVRFSKEAPNV